MPLRMASGLRGIAGGVDEDLKRAGFVRLDPIATLRLKAYLLYDVYLNITFITIITYYNDSFVLADHLTGSQSLWREVW